ncbi:MAG: glycosyltransferase family 1 protein [Deltaproteobacteria bacterium]|nr:glycosyltransferase family 1 protein [Deltaproteobacteria bacterium]
MKILFITHPYPNYAPDLLLHGLRKLMGADVVEYPRKSCLYEGVLGLGICPDNQLCPGWFPDDNDQINREDIWEKIRAGYFKYIICDYRAFSLLLDNLSDWPPGLVVIDGEDSPQKIPPGKYVICRRETDGSDFSIPLPMALPEEILRWISSYDNEHKEYSIGFLGSTLDGERKRILDSLVNFYPDTLFQATVVPTKTNTSPHGRFSRDEYYMNLQKCRIVLSLSGAGHDTFRFWENAACNAVHVSYRFPLYIPDNFIEGRHILRFSDINELRKNVDIILENKARAEDINKNGYSHLVNYHLTTVRATYFLDRIKLTFME